MIVIVIQQELSILSYSASEHSNTVYAKMFALENFREIYSNSISWKTFSRNPVLLKPRPFTTCILFDETVTVQVEE